MERESGRGLEAKRRFQQIIRERIVLLCEEQALSYYTLAYRASMPLTSLMNILDGASTNPGVYNIMKICDGLDMTMAEFFDTKEFVELMVESRDEK